MARGLLDLVNQYKQGKEKEKAYDDFLKNKDLSTRMTQRNTLRRLEGAGLGSTPVGYSDPHKQPLWEFEGVKNPFDMQREDYSDFIESGEWNYPHKNNMLTANEMKAQMMADYDIVHKGRQRASDKMDAIIDSSKAAYDAKPKNVLEAVSRKMGFGE